MKGTNQAARKMADSQQRKGRQRGGKIQRRKSRQLGGETSHQEIEVERNWSLQAFTSADLSKSKAKEAEIKNQFLDIQRT